jgi:LemA protein
MNTYPAQSSGSGWKIGCLAVIGIVLALAIGLGVAFVSLYNKSVALEEGTREKWSEVENQLKRRYDLIPNLVETVKGYAKHEKELFTDIANARKAYFQAESVGDKAKAAGGLEKALSRLLLLRERYPQLKANQNFLKLQDSLEGTENRIAVARTRYNEAVKELNSFVRSFFGRFFAAFTGVKEAEYFEIPEEEKETMGEPPKVDFKGTEGP